jgi:hypothetical protein
MIRAVLVVLVAAVAAVAACARPSASTAPPEASTDFAEVPGLGSTRIDVPRPSGPVAATCQPLSHGPTDGEATAERVAGLRKLGFFAGRTESDAALAATIDEQSIAEFGTAPDPDNPISDLVVAGVDDQRVWWNDLEADVGPSNNVYASTLDAWSAISVGAFAPTAVQETWASSSGPITVAFTLEGKRETLKPSYLEDWIDPAILTRINALIEPTGRQFELYRAFDQTLFLTALTAEEKRALERDRGWCFEWPSSR